MTERVADCGRLLYDETILPKGRELRKQRVLNASAASIGFFLASAGFGYVAYQYGSNLPTLVDEMILAVVFSSLIGTYFLYSALTAGYLRVYERGIVIIRPHARAIIWPFASIEKISLVSSRRGRETILIKLKKEASKPPFKSRNLVLEDKERIADYGEFLAALRGRVNLDSMD